VKATGNNGKTHNTTAKKQVAQDMLDIQAVYLKLAGLTHLEIAQNLGVSNNRMWASRAIRRACRRYGTPPADEYRIREDIRIDQLFGIYWPQALAGNLRAAELCRGLSADRRRLWGLDLAPVANVNIGPLAGATLVDARSVNVNLPDSPDELLELDRALRLVESLTSPASPPPPSIPR
jgi:hypothetical protein